MPTQASATGQGELEMSLPPRLFSATPSRLTTWLDCPRRYRFVYLDRPTPPRGAPWAHNTVGAAVHLALAGWWSLPVEQRTPEVAGRSLRAQWKPMGFRDDAQAAEWRERAAAMVERYVETLDPADEPLGVERTVAMRTDRLALSGRIDRLDMRGDELVVVDYKTGRHVLSTDDARGSLALAVYAMAAERTLRRRCRTVELHHLPSGDVIRWEHTDASLARHRDRADAIGAEAAAARDTLNAGADPDETFPARPGPMCTWCDFCASCPAGREAVAQRPYPWAGLPSDISSTVDDVVDLR